MNELQNNIIKWAKDRGIHYPENAKNQLLKSFEEMGELASSLLNGDTAAMKDAIGDVLVTLIILSSTQETSINECLELAWNEIKDRKGKTINGTFIKNQDYNIKIAKKKFTDYCFKNDLRISYIFNNTIKNPFPIGAYTLKKIFYLDKNVNPLKIDKLIYFLDEQ